MTTFLESMFSVLDRLDVSEFRTPLNSIDEPYLAALVARGLAECNGVGFRRAQSTVSNQNLRRTDRPGEAAAIRAYSADMIPKAPSVPVLDFSTMDLPDDGPTWREDDVPTIVSGPGYHSRYETA